MMYFYLVPVPFPPECAGQETDAPGTPSRPVERGVAKENGGRLTLRNLPCSLSAQQVEHLLATKLPTLAFSSLYVPLSRNKDRGNKGYCFVTIMGREVEDHLTRELCGYDLWRHDYGLLSHNSSSWSWADDQDPKAPSRTASRRRTAQAARAKVKVREVVPSSQQRRWT